MNENQEVLEEELENTTEPENNDTGSEVSTVEEVIEQADTEELSKFDNYDDWVASQISKIEAEKEEETTQVTETEQQGTDEDTDTDTNTTGSMSADEFKQFVTGKFRANGVDVQIDDPNEIRRLMQFGMNYHKKMGEIATKRKMLKALSENGIDETSVNFVIDVMKGKPEAIAELLRKHEVDTYNLPDLEETPYSASDHMPSDALIKYEEIVNEIQEENANSKALQFARTLPIEDFSKIYQNPIMLKNMAIHEQIGVFDDAMSILAKEKMLGNIPEGVTELDAYATIAHQLTENNPEKYGFNKPEPKKKVLGNNVRKTNQTNQQSAKFNASIPNTQVQTQTKQTYSGVDAILNASAEELAKFNSYEEFLAQATK